MWLTQPGFRFNVTTSRRQDGTRCPFSDVLTATKVLAASRERSKSEVVEDALRAYLCAGELEAARADLRALMTRVAERTDLDDEAPMALAVDEVRAVRTSRRSAVTP